MSALPSPGVVGVQPCLAPWHVARPSLGFAAPSPRPSLGFAPCLPIGGQGTSSGRIAAGWVGTVWAGARLAFHTPPRGVPEIIRDG